MTGNTPGTPTPGPPTLTAPARTWLIGTVLIAVAIQMGLVILGVEFPCSAELAVTIEDMVLGSMSLAIVLLVARIDRRDIGITFGDRKTTLRRTLIQIIVLAGFASLYTVGVIVSARLGHARIPVHPTSLTDFDNAWLFVFLALGVGPLYEEVLFRGMLLTGLDGPGRGWQAILGSATVCAAAHWGPSLPVLALIGPFLTGVLFGWSYSRTRSISTSIAVHAAYNGGVIAKDFLMQYHPDLVRRALGY